MRSVSTLRPQHTDSKQATRQAFSLVTRTRTCIRTRTRIVHARVCISQRHMTLCVLPTHCDGDGAGVSHEIFDGLEVLHNGQRQKNVGSADTWHWCSDRRNKAHTHTHTHSETRTLRRMHMATWLPWFFPLTADSMCVCVLASELTCACVCKRAIIC